MSINYAVVIPARYQSTRFPGKPLVDLNGKTMIQRVWERCCKAVPKEMVYIATDSEEISSEVKKFGGQVVMTSSGCITGTDRVAESNLNLDRDFLINVQGDEPLINPNDIKLVVKTYQDNPGVIVNCMSVIKSQEEFRSLTVPKVVTTITGKLMYMSRAAVPGSKSDKFGKAYKQVCIYAFSREHLSFFFSQNKKTPVEESEDIEILRFLENDIPIQMVEVESSSMAVDTPCDADKVRKLLAVME